MLTFREPLTLALVKEMSHTARIDGTVIDERGGCQSASGNQNGND